MRIKHAIFACAMAALASLIGPALANHSDAPKASEQSTSSPCSAEQRMPDGTWVQLPCRELGAPEQGHHKSAARGPDEPARGEHPLAGGLFVIAGLVPAIHVILA